MSMEITIAIHLEKIRIKVTPAKNRIGDIVGFVQLDFIDDQNNIFVSGRGFTIRVKTFNNISTFVADAPAYKSGFKYRKSFIVDNIILWHDIEKSILEDFSNQTGGKKPEDYIAEDINPDDIPEFS